MNEYHTAPQAAPHHPFYSSTYATVPLRYPESNTHDDAAATWHMTTTNDVNVGQIDSQPIYIVEGDNGTDEGREERYVVWGEFGNLKFDPVRLGAAFTDVLALGQHAQENDPSAHSGPIHGASTANIPELAYRSQHPTRTEVPSPPAGHFDMNREHSRDDAPVGPVRQEASGRKRRKALHRVYDKPGKKPAVNCEQNVPRLQEISRQRGGEGFAITWIAKAFANGVTTDALTRTLSIEEANAVNHNHGFRLSRAYDGFLEKVEDRFGCGLCPEENRANWKNKKDSVRHFQKFHLGIGETCGVW